MSAAQVSSGSFSSRLDCLDYDEVVSKAPVEAFDGIVPKDPATATIAFCSSGSVPATVVCLPDDRIIAAGLIAIIESDAVIKRERTHARQHKWLATVSRERARERERAKAREKEKTVMRFHKSPSTCSVTWHPIRVLE